VVRTAYEIAKGKLISTKVEWGVPTFFPEGEGEHSVTEQIQFCRSHLDKGGKMIGAFDDDALVGVGLITPEVRPKIAQLAYLHVSADYRRQGIAARLLDKLTEWASDGGARQIYVSAIPTESAVGFYLRQGFRPVNQPLRELFELEPEDIHMIKKLS
jgi:GNAT superfamily N-acetyltransferase